MECVDSGLEKHLTQGPSAKIGLERVSQNVESLEQAVTTVDTSDDEPFVRNHDGSALCPQGG